MIKSLVIVGSGLAGYMLAKEFRKLNKEARLVIVTEDDGHFYSKPQLSNALLHGKTAESLVMTSREQMEDQLDAEIVAQATVTAINAQEHRVFVGDRSFEYDRLVLACGARVINVPLQGDAVDRLVSVNNISDYAHFRQWLSGKKHIGVLGAGLVGCEFANDVLNGGFDVSVFSLDAYPLPRLVPSSLGVVLQEALSEKGVRWHLNNAVTTVNALDSGCELTLADGKKVEVDGVMSAVGLRADVSLAQQAGLTVQKGIVVNEYLQTSDADIYALGDCAEVGGQVLQYVAPLLLCARALAKTLAGDDTTVNYPLMPVVVKTPACPVVSALPLSDMDGEWVVEGDGLDWQARFVDGNGALHGFALTGGCVKQRMALIKEMS
jgi:rubredoxin-NAD+ reductase